jgi:hemerythrin
MENGGIIEWNERYSVGIKLIDDQHKELLRLINNFYLGCMQDRKNAEISFKLTIHGLINYIECHFAAEEQFLERIKYPDIAAHRRQHKEYIRVLRERRENFERGNVGSLKNFARYIRDWIVTHITLIDKKYATYIHFVNSQANNRAVYGHGAWFRGGFTAEPEDVPSENFFG